MIEIEALQSLINSGEGYKVEFKVRIPSKVRKLTEEICAFANAEVAALDLAARHKHLGAVRRDGLQAVHRARRVTHRDQ